MGGVDTDTGTATGPAAAAARAAAVGALARALRAADAGAPCPFTVDARRVRLSALPPQGDGEAAGADVGLYARAPIDEGDVLVQVPFRRTLGERALAGRACGAAIAELRSAAAVAAAESAWVFVQPGEVATAAAIALVEALPEETDYDEWRPYVHALPPPAARVAMPLLWDDGAPELGVAGAADGTQVGAAIRRLRREGDAAAALAGPVLLECAPRAFGGNGDSGACSDGGAGSESGNDRGSEGSGGGGTGEGGRGGNAAAAALRAARRAFLGALSMVQSRSFGLDEEELEECDEAERAQVSAGSNMVPYIDMCNGALDGDSNVECIVAPIAPPPGVRAPPTMCMVLRAERGIEAGEELLLSYGETSTAEFVAKYGCPPAARGAGEPHALDCAVLWPPSDALPPAESDASAGADTFAQAALRAALREAVGASCEQLMRPLAAVHGAADAADAMLVSPFTLTCDDLNCALAAAEAADDEGGIAGDAAVEEVPALGMLRCVAGVLAEHPLGGCGSGGRSGGATAREVMLAFVDDALTRCVPPPPVGDGTPSAGEAGARYARAAERALLERWRDALT